MLLWLGREVAFHPRGYYRLGLSLAKRWRLTLWGRTFSALQIEGPLAEQIHLSTWEKLTSVPSSPLSLEIRFLDREPSLPSLFSAQPIFLCNPADLWRAIFHPTALWDVWEDYPKNFRYDPTYSLWQRVKRTLQWYLLYPLRLLPKGYTLAEYTYAPSYPLSKSLFLPNAFVSVENEPPLLPNLTHSYALYTGNLTESWGVLAVVEEALKFPQTPLVIAGSLKSSRIESLLRSALKNHKQWLWIYSRFVPYPVLQNLQRYSKLLYAFYQPLPHLRDKVPGKFYEAAALGIPLRYNEGKSSVWDAFWRRYKHASTAPELYWCHYEVELWKWLESLFNEIG
ncbi:MAG: hypothetical protein N2253_06675 [Bacteroidia bacterium]|nr:hypothetical protein [Bacteroidia bacterium]MCX7764557.1 hypothetical protein [Bacteroidia bacterium]MDW8058352.1 hypothetical protein [Bacteroidia bacterium]